MSVIQNCNLGYVFLKKKHVDIDFRKTIEASTAGICDPIKIRMEHNFEDLSTKAVTRKTFWNIFGALSSG